MTDLLLAFVAGMASAVVIGSVWVRWYFRDVWRG